MGTNYRTKYFFDNYLGINERDFLSRKRGEADSLSNVLFPQRNIKKRPGMTKLNEVSIGDVACLRLYDFRPEGHDNILISVWSDGTIRKMEGLDGEWDTIGDSFTPGIDVVWGFATFNDICIMGNGIEVLQKYEYGDAVVSALGGSPPKSNKFVVFHNFLVLADADNPSTIKWSSYSNCQIWPVTNYLPINTNDNDSLTAICKLGNYVYLTKNRSCHQLNFTGNLESEEYAFGVEQAVENKGTVAQNLIQIVDGKYLVIPNLDDIYAYAGGVDMPSLAQQRIKTTYDSLNKGRLKYGASVNYDKEKLYLLSASVGSNTYESKIIGFDYANKGLLIIDGWKLRSLVSYLDNSEEVLIGGCSDEVGFAYKLFEGENDDTEAISSYWGNGWEHCDSPDTLKYFRNLIVYAKIEGDWDLDVYYKTARKDIGFPSGDGQRKNVNLSGTATLLGTTFVLGTSPLGGEECLIITVPLEVWGEWIRIMFKNANADEPFEILGYALQYEPVRQN